MCYRGLMCCCTVAGIWGARVCDLAERYGANVVNMEAPAGQGYSLEQLTAAVEQHKPAVLFVVQGESSTGVQQSLAGAGRSDCALGHGRHSVCWARQSQWHSGTTTRAGLTRDPGTNGM